ncbi:MAG: hypothetical protein LBQ15_11025 [Clostridium sp.]|jgi:hypothetical protein|nr:hypothetical protein [Clostridium sp.]
MRYICGRCGAHLDPGERCDCMDEKPESEAKKGGELVTEIITGKRCKNAQESYGLEAAE